MLAVRSAADAGISRFFRNRPPALTPAFFWRSRQLRVGAAHEKRVLQNVTGALAEELTDREFYWDKPATLARSPSHIGQAPVPGRCSSSSIMVAEPLSLSPDFVSSNPSRLRQAEKR